MLYSVIIGMLIACSGEATDEQSTEPVQQTAANQKQKKKKDQFTILKEQVYSGGQTDEAFSSLLTMVQKKGKTKIPKEKLMGLLYYASMSVNNTSQALAALEEAN